MTPEEIYHKLVLDFNLKEDTFPGTKPMHKAIAKPPSDYIKNLGNIIALENNGDLLIAKSVFITDDNAKWCYYSNYNTFNSHADFLLHFNQLLNSFYDAEKHIKELINEKRISKLQTDF